MGDLSPFEVIEAIERETRPQGAIARFASELNSVGYHSFGCAEIPAPGESLESGILANAWPQEWLERYVQERYVERDPVALMMRQTIRPFTWKEVIARGVGRKYHHIVHEASEWKMNSGFVVPIFGHRGRSAVVTMAGDKIDDNPRTRPALHVMALHLYYKLSQLAQRAPEAAPDLTPRQSECLGWIAAGKSDWEIAAILNISEATVHFHVEEAKRKFGVATRTQAVVLAVQRQLIAV